MHGYLPCGALAAARGKHQCFHMHAAHARGGAGSKAKACALFGNLGYKAGQRHRNVGILQFINKALCVFAACQLFAKAHKAKAVVDALL